MDRLPIEITLAIVHEVPDFQDRLELLQVCRQWRALFLATAFRSIHIAWPQLRCLVVAATANLAIRSSIREVSVDVSVPKVAQSDARVKLGPAVQDLIDLLSDSPVEWEAWRYQLSRNRVEAWIALLLALLPNLTTISARHNRPEGFIARVVAKAAWKQTPFDANTFPALQRLESLDLTWRDLSVVMNYREYLPFFHLPSLRALRLGPVQEPQTPYNVADHPAFLPAPATSPVESLVLDYFCNGKHGMADFITSCANLKRFVYQHTNDMIWVWNEEEQHFGGLDASFRPWCFHAALLTQKHSLEALHLNHLGDASIPRHTDRDYGEIADTNSHNRWFGSLAEFSRLWDLRIRASNLLNLQPKEKENVVLLKDILPRSLKHLHLADCNEDDCALLISNLEDILAQRAERFPNLQSFLISPAPREPHDSLIGIRQSFIDRWTGLQQACERVGVQFSLGVGEKMIPDVDNWWPGKIVDMELSD